MKMKMKTKIDKPLVSICMPMYNAADYIAEALTKISEQSYQNIEVIVVNDHSSDCSLEVARQYESDKIKVYTNLGKGACSARNYAFSKSTGEFVKFMDADDYCMPKLIEKQVDLLVRGTERTVIFSPLMHLYPDGRLFQPPRSIDHDHDDAFDLQIEIMQGGGTNVPHCYLMPRDLIITTGGWDEMVLKNQDGEYFARVLANADKALSLADEFAIYRKIGSGLSSKLSFEAISSKLDTYKKIINLVLDRQNNDQMKEMCGLYLGKFLFTNYQELKSILNEVKKIQNESCLPLIFPDRRLFKLFSTLFGWKAALALMHKLNLINKLG
jgi:glycosyltransferase involved in cell wall biosynthesis